MLPTETFEKPIYALLILLLVGTCTGVATLVTHLRYVRHQDEFSPLTLEQKKTRKRTYLVVRLLGRVAIAGAIINAIGTCFGRYLP